MIVLVDVVDSRYSSGLRVQTWNVESITKEIYEYVDKYRSKVCKVWFRDTLYSNSEYASPGGTVCDFLKKYKYLMEDEP